MKTKTTNVESGDTDVGYMVVGKILYEAQAGAGVEVKSSPWI
jgi:hypothetical protein